MNLKALEFDSYKGTTTPIRHFLIFRAESSLMARSLHPGARWANYRFVDADPDAVLAYAAFPVQVLDALERGQVVEVSPLGHCWGYADPVGNSAWTMHDLSKVPR